MAEILQLCDGVSNTVALAALHSGLDLFFIAPTTSSPL